MIAGYLATTATAAIEPIGGPQIDYAKLTPILLVHVAAPV